MRILVGVQVATGIMEVVIQPNQTNVQISTTKEIVNSGVAIGGVALVMIHLNRRIYVHGFKLTGR